MLYYICIVKTKTFLFDDVCVPPDRQIGLHSHADWELSYVICGAGIRTIGDCTEPFRQGEIILVPPDMLHVWRFDPGITDSDGNIANISVFFDPMLIGRMIELFPEIAGPLERIAELRQAVCYSGTVYHTILNLLLSMRGLSARNRLPKMMELLIAISDMTESRYTGRDNLMSRIEQRLEKVRVYCACNYARHITLDQLSRHVGMNRSAFCTFMRKNTGMTLSEFVNRLRLERAREKLLHTDCNISEIAIDCGFQNISYFNRLFRSHYGCTPKSIRTTGVD